MFLLYDTASFTHIFYVQHNLILWPGDVKYELPQVLSPDSHVAIDKIHETQDAANVLCWVWRRGVTRLDSARGKKQFWRPHVRNWGLSEANVLYWRK